MTFRHKFGDRVITPDGAIGDVVRNTLEPQGETTTVQVTRQETYASTSLHPADPATLAAMKRLQDENSALRTNLTIERDTAANLRNRAGELVTENESLHKRLSRPKAKSSKKRR